MIICNSNDGCILPISIYRVDGHQNKRRGKYRQKDFIRPGNTLPGMFQKDNNQGDAQTKIERNTTYNW